MISSRVHLGVVLAHMRGNRKRLTCGYAGNSLGGPGGADRRGLGEYSVSFMIHLETNY